MMLEQEEGACAYYDMISSEYDAASAEYHWTPPQVSNEMTLPHAKSGDSVLDVGVGTGQTAEAFLSMGCKVCGMDISDKMLEIARKKFPALDLHQGDIAQPPPFLKNRSFDIVLAVGILEFVTDVGNVIRTLSCAQKKHGFMCVTYEDLMDSHEVQKVRSSPTALGIKNSTPEIDKFMTFRYKYEEVESILKENGQHILKRKHFRAYEKSRKRTPIFYTAILTRKE